MLCSCNGIHANLVDCTKGQMRHRAVTITYLNVLMQRFHSAHANSHTQTTQRLYKVTQINRETRNPSSKSDGDRFRAVGAKILSRTCGLIPTRRGAGASTARKKSSKRRTLRSSPWDVLVWRSIFLNLQISVISEKWTERQNIQIDQTVKKYFWIWIFYLL